MRCSGYQKRCMLPLDCRGKPQLLTEVPESILPIIPGIPLLSPTTPGQPAGRSGSWGTALILHRIQIFLAQEGDDLAEHEQSISAYMQQNPCSLRFHQTLLHSRMQCHSHCLYILAGCAEGSETA